MTRLTNTAGVDLSAAVWLAHDDYDYVDKPNYISVTTLIRPLRQIILGARARQLIQQTDAPVGDVMDFFKSRLGQNLHTGVEVAWKENYRNSMKRLGYPSRVIDMVRINPDTEEPDTIPVYTEQRTERVIEGYTVGGKIDLIIEGRLRDVKSTTVFKYQAQSGVGKWRLQGSLYRWLNPGKVTHGELLVQYLLLDWSRAFASRDPKYPAHPAPHRVVELMTVEETEKWTRNKLRLLTQYADAPEDTIPDCPDEDLWRTDPVHKYYANPEKTDGRSTKNFDDLGTAQLHLSQQGKGVIITKPGLVKACNFCEGAALCSQRNRLLAAGELAE